MAGTKAVITGASKGIGKAISSLFADKGIDIAICARNPEPLFALKQELEQKHSDIEVLALPTDVSNASEVKSFASQVLDQWGQVNILVNNAGVFLPGELLDEPEAHLFQMIDTNLYSAYHLSRALVPSMISGGTGHIFNICSTASKMAYPAGSSYSISKWALLGFNHSLRRELMDKGVRVTAVLPGPTWSASWEGSGVEPERLMPAEDIAHAVWSAFALSANSVVEEIRLRPQLGDL